jgi:hypothetical protein
MGRPINWDSRLRQLAKRAFAEDIGEPRQSERALSDIMAMDVSEQADRELAAEIGRLYQNERERIEPKGAWHIRCDECGRSFQVKAALSSASSARFDCPEFGLVHQLIDLKLPWD